MKREISQKRSIAIKQLLESGWTVADLARIYGLSQQSIWRIKYSKEPVDKKQENGLNNKETVPLERVAQQ